ncbi:MAG: hypothetical protein JO360_02490 [Acidobacteria bacterium]|nr:hypothetical protein [Acidobacteriota bacterium]
MSEDGTKPFEAFIRRLKTREERAECMTWIEFLRQRGDMLDGHQHRTPVLGLCEIRDRSMRIFYLRDGDAIVIIDGLLPNQGKEFFEEICRKAEDYVSDD